MVNGISSSFSTLPRLTRRGALCSLTCTIASAPLNKLAMAQQYAAVAAEGGRIVPSQDDLIGALAKYMVAARDVLLPEAALLDAKHRVLDGIVAAVSGARLPAGEAATRFVRAQGGTPEASILGTDLKSSVINAAFANGMLAHADETDDVDPTTKAHPGAAIVPAALAVAEHNGRSGNDLIRAVTLGYDIGCRFVIALGGDALRVHHRSVEGPCSTMGAMAAAASLVRLDDTGMRYALSYGAQQVSGLYSWVDDRDHIEKAFDMSGMGARNGVTAALMVQSGMTGVPDVFRGRHNVIDALAVHAQPEALLAGLGNRFFVSETGVKLFPVGYPNHSALDALLSLCREYKLRADDVQAVVVRMPEDGASIVSNSSMPNVNCQYLVATAILDGGISFDHSHSVEHMADPRVKVMMQRVQVVGDPKLKDRTAPRSGAVDITLKDGRTLTRFTRFPPGSRENPATTEALNAKAIDLMTPVLGSDNTRKLVEKINDLEKINDVSEIMPLLRTT